MAYPKTRSSIDELNQGMIDGTYRQIAPNRGGEIEPTTWAARKDLNDVWYGLHEATLKELPDGIGPAHTPTTVSTPPASPPYC